MGTAALLAPGLILFLIFGASVIFKTVVKRKTITVFETVQTMIAFLLAACGWLYFGPGGGAIGLGIFCLVLSAAGYAAVFAIFDRESRTAQLCCVCLLERGAFSGRRVVVPAASWMGGVSGRGRNHFTVLGVRLKRLTLEVHGVVFLVAAAAVSGLLSMDSTRLRGRCRERRGGAFALSRLARRFAMRLGGTARESRGSGRFFLLSSLQWRLAPWRR